MLINNIKILEIKNENDVPIIPNVGINNAASINWITSGRSEIFGKNARNSSKI